MMGKITILILCLMVALTSQASATLADEPPAQIEPLATLSQVESIQQSMESRLASLETSNATTPYMISQLASIQEAHASRLAAQDETQAQVVLQLFALLEQNEITTAIQNAVLENALIYSNYVLGRVATTKKT